MNTKADKPERDLEIIRHCVESSEFVLYDTKKSFQTILTSAVTRARRDERNRCFEIAKPYLGTKAGKAILKKILDGSYADETE